MAEEHGCQSPEGHRLCENNCGFFGSPATQNMCSKCYGDVCLKNSFPPKQPPTAAVPSFTAPPPIVDVILLPEMAATESPVVPATANRCSSCRRKVGLTGFRCRCGTTFCGTHRYPERHGCTFDFKAVGREAIAKANPLVKGEKLHRI